MNVRRRDLQRQRTETLLVSPGGGYAQFARFAGSKITLAAEVFSSDIPHGAGQPGLGWVAQDLFTGPPRGPLTRVGTRCDLGGTPQLPQTLDVYGTFVIHLDCDRQSVVVTDVRTGQATPVPAESSGLRIAGRYIAWIGCCRGAGPVSVYDWKAKQPVYMIPGSKAGGGLSDLDLGADGTLVITKPPEKQHQIGSRLAWASVSAPRLHVIPLERSEYFVKLVGGKLAFERGRDDSGDVPRAEVGVTDLQGHARVLARGAYAAFVDRRFDFDGKRVAWYAYSCTGARMHVQSITSKLVTESLTRCPLRLTEEPRVRKGGFADLRFDCYGYSGGHFNYPPSCWASDVLLTTRSSGEHVIVARGSNARHLPLTDVGKKLLKQRGHLEVRIAATLQDPAGTHERRHGATVIRAPE